MSSRPSPARPTAALDAVGRATAASFTRLKPWRWTSARTIGWRPEARAGPGTRSSVGVGGLPHRLDHRHWAGSPSAHAGHRPQLTPLRAANDCTSSAGQHLAAVSCGAQPGRLYYWRAEVVAVDLVDLARRDADPHRQLLTSRPLVAHTRSLGAWRLRRPRPRTPTRRRPSHRRRGSSPRARHAGPCRRAGTRSAPAAAPRSRPVRPAAAIAVEPTRSVNTTLTMRTAIEYPHEPLACGAETTPGLPELRSRPPAP